MVIQSSMSGEESVQKIDSIVKSTEQMITYPRVPTSLEIGREKWHKTEIQGHQHLRKCHTGGPCKDKEKENWTKTFRVEINENTAKNISQRNEGKDFLNFKINITQNINYLRNNNSFLKLCIVLWNIGNWKKEWKIKCAKFLYWNRIESKAIVSSWPW